MTKNKTHWFMLIFRAVYLCRLLHVLQSPIPTGFRWRAPLSCPGCEWVCRCVNWFPIGWTCIYPPYAYLRCWLTDLYGLAIAYALITVFFRLMDCVEIAIGIGIRIGIRMTVSVTITIDPWHKPHFVFFFWVISKVLAKMTYFVSII